MDRHSFLFLLQVSYYEGDYMKEVSRERYLAWEDVSTEFQSEEADGKGPAQRRRWKWENNTELDQKEEDGRI